MCPDMPLAAFGSGHVVSASRRKKKEQRPKLQGDDRVTKEGAVEIADRFMGPVPASTSRLRALERILYRHRKLMNFATGSASIGGKKSAA